MDVIPTTSFIVGYAETALLARDWGNWPFKNPSLSANNH
jgi:hypothetical protein